MTTALPIERTMRVFRRRPTIHPPGASTSPLSFRKRPPLVLRGHRHRTVILGTGVGGGIAVDGAVLGGSNRIAGEWGHNPLPWADDAERPGPPCYCGKRGCIETFLSGPGLCRDHRSATGEARGAEEIAAAAAAGDASSRATLERYAERLARALAHVINILDPDAIVLGGGLSNVPLWYERVPR